jgi:hypothetical protein
MVLMNFPSFRPTQGRRVALPPFDFVLDDPPMSWELKVDFSTAEREATLLAKCLLGESIQ